MRMLEDQKLFQFRGRLYMFRAAIKIKNEGHYLLLGLVQQWLTAT